MVALHHIFFSPLTCLETAKFVLVIDLCYRDFYCWIQLYVVVGVQDEWCGHMHDRYIVLFCGFKQFGLGWVQPLTAMLLNTTHHSLVSFALARSWSLH